MEHTQTDMKKESQIERADGSRGADLESTYCKEEHCMCGSLGRGTRSEGRQHCHMCAVGCPRRTVCYRHSIQTMCRRCRWAALWVLWQRCWWSAGVEGQLLSVEGQWFLASTANRCCYRTRGQFHSRLEPCSRRLRRQSQAVRWRCLKGLKEW